MDLIFGFLLRAMARFLRRRFPRMASFIGLGSETVEALSPKTAEMVGKTGKVEIALQGGRGRVLIGGSSWIAEGEDAPVGSFVRVIRVDGTCLIVERA